MVWFNATYLWLLLLIPVLAAGFYWLMQRRKKKRERFFSERLVEKLRRGYWPIGERLRVIFLLAAFSLFVIGLAGPKIGTEVRDMEQRGVDMLIALDLSQSMNAEDIRPSRLQKAKFEIQRLIDHSSGDRIGLIVFTGEAFVQSPMTLDHSALRLFLDIADTGQMPNGTTNFRSTFAKALETFESFEDQQSEAARVLLVISDGEDHGPSFNRELNALTDRGILTFTVGIGTRDGGRIPLYEEGTIVGYHRDRQGNEVETRLEPQTLREIANRGGGNYYEINSGTANIDPFLARMDELQTGEFSVQEYADYQNRYQLLLIAGILFFIAGLVIPEFKKD